MIKICSRKILAVFLGLAMAVSQPVYAQTAGMVSDAAGQVKDAGASLNPAKTSVNPGQTVVRPDLNPYNINIPSEFGNIEEIYHGAADSPLVIYLQDVHANYEAQMNIRKILAHLVEQYQFSLIQLEGAFSKLNPQILQPSYLKEANLKMVEFLLREGRVSGADAFAVETDKVVDLFGIEDKDLYLENLRIFKSVYAREAEARDYFSKIERLSSLVSRKIFDFGRLDFTRKVREFSQHKIDLLDYLLYLNQVSEANGLSSLKNLGEITRYPNLVRIMRVYELEKALDRSKLDRESADLKTNLENKLPDAAPFEPILSRIGRTDTGTQPRDYFTQLTRIADQTDVSFMGYPQIRILTEYLVYQDEIDHRGVFPELQKFQAEIENKLFTTNDQKRLLRLIEDANLLEQFFALSMTRELLGVYVARQNEIRPSVIVSGLKGLAEKELVPAPDFGDLSSLDGAMEELEYYYRLVLTRDGAFFRRITENMKQAGTERSIVVTGGFHKDGLAAKFRKDKISYVVINPKVGIDQGNENYVKIMLEGDSAITGVFAGTFALAALEIIGAFRTGVQNWILVNKAVVAMMITRAIRGTSVSDQQFTQEARERINTYVESVLVKNPIIEINKVTGTQYVRAEGTAGFYIGEFGEEKYVELGFRGLYYPERGTFEVNWRNVRATGMKDEVAPPAETTGMFNQSVVVDLREANISDQLPLISPTKNLAPNNLSGDVLLLEGNLLMETIEKLLKYSDNPLALETIRKALEAGATLDEALESLSITENVFGVLTEALIAQAVPEELRSAVTAALYGPSALQEKSVPRVLAVVSDALTAEATEPDKLLRSEIIALAQTLARNEAAIAVYYSLATKNYLEHVLSTAGLSREALASVLARVELVEIKKGEEPEKILASDIARQQFYTYYKKRAGEYGKSVTSATQIRQMIRILAPESIIPKDGPLNQIAALLSVASSDKVAQNDRNAVVSLQMWLLPYLPSTEDERRAFNDQILKEMGDPQIIDSKGNFRFSLNIANLARILSIHQAAQRAIAAAA